MAAYILLLTLTPEGQEKMLQDSDLVLSTGNVLAGHGVQILGLYGVLGAYDFVGIVEAPDNEAVARFSVRWGAKAGVHVTTLPAIPISRFEESVPDESKPVVAAAAVPWDPTEFPPDEWDLPKLPA